MLWGKQDRFILKPGMYALTGGGVSAEWICLRYPGRQHLEVLVVDPEWLKSRLGRSLMHPEMTGWLAKNCPVGFCGLMGMWENELFDALLGIPERPGPESLLAEAKILQWAAIRLCRSAGLNQVPTFCANLRELGPARRALAYLAETYDQPLDLAALARRVGLAAHYLSRKVRSETGMTLQRHLRRIRIEHACQQLSAGRSNITETALDVGYQSLSHFAKAFREETGKSPREWLAGNRKGS